jgi:hypothetical protein
VDRLREGGGEGIVAPCYVLVWADTDLHLRVLGIYATRPQAEKAAAADFDGVLEWRDYKNDTPPCWFANVRAQDLRGEIPSPGT